MEEHTKAIEGWDNYIKNFLTPADVTSSDQKFEVVNIEEVDNRGTKCIRLHLKNSEKIKYLMDLNKTNSVYIKKAGLKHPREIVERFISFDTVKVYNPSEKKEVDGLRINAITQPE